MAIVKIDTQSEKLNRDNNHVYKWLLQSCNMLGFSPVELGPETGTIMWWDESIGSMRTTNYLTWFSVEVPDFKQTVFDAMLKSYQEQIEEAPKQAEARRAARKAAEEAEAAAKAERKRIREQEAEAKAERKRAREEKHAAKVAADLAKLATHRANNAENA